MVVSEKPIMMSAVVKHAVRVMGPYNLAATLPFHASQLYAKNVANFVLNMTKNGALQLDADDEIVRDTMLARGGELTSPRVRELLGLAPASAPATQGA